MTTLIQISTGTDVLFHNEMQQYDSLIWRIQLEQNLQRA